MNGFPMIVMEQLRFQASADRGVVEVHPHPLASSAESWDPVCLSLPFVSKRVPHPSRAARRTPAIIMKSAKPSNTAPSQATAPRSWRHRAWALLLAVTPLGAACDFIAQKDLTPGQSTEADVRRWMGQPEMIWEESDGSRTLEYPRGPMGKETYFVTIGADGRFRSIEQVLTEENFRKVQPGMTRDQVRQILGKPGEISRFKRQNEEVWGWRYLEATQRTMFFYAHFDQDTGLLKRTDQMQDWKTSKH